MALHGSTSTSTSGRGIPAFQSASSCALRRPLGARLPARQWARPPPAAAQAAHSFAARGSTATSNSVRDMSRQMREMRAELESNEEVAAMMATLRGANLRDQDFADQGVQMRLVEVAGADADGDALPLVYDPDQIAAYWERRPTAVATRITQLLGE